MPASCASTLKIYLCSQHKAWLLLNHIILLLFSPLGTILLASSYSIEYKKEGKQYQAMHMPTCMPGYVPEPVHTSYTHNVPSAACVDQPGQAVVRLIKCERSQRSHFTTQYRRENSAVGAFCVSAHCIMRWHCLWAALNDGMTALRPVKIYGMLDSTRMHRHDRTGLPGRYLTHECELIHTAVKGQY